MHNLVADSSLPFQFAIPSKPAISLFVDQVNTGPDAVAIAGPVRLIIIHSHGMGQAGCFQLLLELVDLVFGISLRRVDTDDGNFRRLILFLHFPVPGIIATTVDSAKGEEMDDYDFASQFS